MSESLGSGVLELDVDDHRMVTGMARAERNVGNGFTRMLKQASRTAVGIGAYFLTIKLGKIFADPIRSAGDFQQTMNVLRVQSQATTGQMKAMQDRAIQLGADLRLPAVSANDAAKAMLELSKGGFNFQQIMQSIHPVLLLGTAAEIDFGEAAKDVVTTLKAFELPTANAAKVVDLLAAAAVASVADIKDITASMTMAAQSFHAAGVPVKDAATAIAELADHGQRGSVAGATLAVAMQKLANPTQKAETLMKKLGISVFDSNGHFIGIRNAIKEVNPVLDKMSEKQRTATLSILGGVRGFRALNILLGGSVKEWDRVAAAVGRQGLAQQLANARTAGFNGAMAGLKSTLQTLSITLGLQLLPKMTEFVRFLNRIASSPSFTVAVKVVWSGIVNLATDLEKSISDALFGKEMKMPAHFQIGKDNIDWEPGIIEKLRDALQKMVQTTNWSAIGKGVADGIAKFIIFSDKVNQAMNSLFNAALSWVNQNQGRIADIGLLIGLKMIQKLLDPGFWAAHWQLIGGIAISALSFAFPAGKLAFVGERIAISLFGKLAELVRPLVLKGLLEVPTLFGTALARIIPAVARAMGKVVTEMVFWGIRIVDALITKISGGFGKLGGIVKVLLYTGIVNIIGNIVGAVAKEAERVAVALARGIKTAPEKLAGLAGDIAGAVSRATSQVAGQALGWAKGIGYAIVSGVLSGIEGLPGALASKLGGMVSGAVSFAGKVYHGSGDWMFTKHVVGEPLAQGIIDGFVERIKILHLQAGQATASALKGAFDSSMKVAMASLDAWLKAGQTKIEAYKAKLTPTEALQAQLAAEAALASVKSSYAQAVAMLQGLKVKQDATWAQLLADQAANLQKMKDAQDKNMAEMQKAQVPKVMDAGIAEHEFGKTVGTNAGNQPALNLLQAKENLETWKQYYAEGKVTLDDVLRYQDAFDNASLAFEQAHDAALLAAGDDTNATALANQQYANGQKLLQDYGTWQDLATQAAQGAEGIAAQAADDAQALYDQQQTDLQARTDQQKTFQDEWSTAWGEFNSAKLALRDYYIDQEAKHERAHTDSQATELNTALVARYNRIQHHLEEVAKRTDAAYAELGRMASKAGTNITGMLATAMSDAADPGSPLDEALKKIAGLIQKYLKTKSPTEIGPMSDLDKWWNGFAPSLIRGLDQKLITDTIGNAVNPNLNEGMLSSYESNARAVAAAANQRNQFTFNHLRADINPTEITESIAYRMRNLRS